MYSGGGDVYSTEATDRASCWWNYWWLGQFAWCYTRRIFNTRHTKEVCIVVHQSDIDYISARFQVDHHHINLFLLFNQSSFLKFVQLWPPTLPNTFSQTGVFLRLK